MHDDNFYPLSGSPRVNRVWSVLDLETTTTLDKVYLAGYYDGENYHHEESTPLVPSDPESALAKMIVWFISEPRPPTYAHNGGNFDFLYIVRWLLEHRQRYGIEFADIIPIQSTMLAFRFKKDGHTFEFLDSLRMMPMGLDDAAKLYGMPGKIKLEDKDYETLHLNPIRYEYLERDCRQAHEVIGRWIETVATLGGRAKMSAASTAMDIFRRRYLKENIPRHSRFHKIFRAGYYGGRNEIFAREIGRGRSYDVNAMYPWAMTHPLPVGKCMSWRPRVPRLREVPDMAFLQGRAHVPVNVLIPPLPWRHDDKLLFPVGDFDGTWTSPEIRQLYAAGGYFEAKQITQFDDAKPLAEDFARDLFAHRQNPKSPLAKAGKIHMNSWYGKTGMDQTREKVYITDDIASLPEGAKPPGGCPFNGVWYVKEEFDAPYIMPQIAAWITSLARCQLWRLLMYCAKHGTVAYCDTDSVLTDIELPADLKYGGLRVGDGLGEMKIDAEFTRARFVAPKLYVLWLLENAEDGTEHETMKLRAKGFSRFGKQQKDWLTYGDIATLEDRGSVDVSRITKFREGLRGEEFPTLKWLPKRLRGTYEKRVLVNDAPSMPRMVRNNLLVPMVDEIQTEVEEHGINA